jgi:predicted ATPase
MVSVNRSGPQWWAVTGAPGAGKTTLVEDLAATGFKTQNEVARALIDREMAGGASLVDIRGDERAFHEQVIRAKLERDLALPPEITIVFDRGIPDSIAFGRCYGWEAPAELEAVDSGRLYAGALILDPLPIASDYAHLDSENERLRVMLDQLLEQAYAENSVPVYRVAVDTRRRRLEVAMDIIGVRSRIDNSPKACS